MHLTNHSARQRLQGDATSFGAVGSPDDPPFLVWDELEDAMPRRFCFGAGMAYGVILGMGLAWGLIWVVR
jgi:hypothetical protein